MLGVIVNPNSKRNRKRKNFRAELEAALEGKGIVIETPNVDAIPAALAELRDAGAMYWLADGGDGALHWMINKACGAFGADWVADNVVFIPSNGGTINYVAKAIKLKGRSLKVAGRLVELLESGGTPPVVEVPCLKMRLESGAGRRASTVYGFGNAFGGYGANFYGPFYDGDAGRGPLRIMAISASGFAAAAGRTAFSGPFRRLKPKFIERAEYDYLRPVVGGALLDGEPVRDRHGEPLRELTVVQCSSIPLNLAVFRVFPEAKDAVMHAQVGDVTPLRMAWCMPGLMTGRSVNGIVPDAYDGPASTLSVWSDGEGMIPILDGEVYEDVYRADVVAGPSFKMAVP